jgi:hypothetical protein
MTVVPARLEKWQIIQATVVSKMSYGLRVQVPSGEIGVLDRVLIQDLPSAESEWPEVGTEIVVVCGGYTTGGQLRLSARESDIDMAKARLGNPSGF